MCEPINHWHKFLITDQNQEKGFLGYLEGTPDRWVFFPAPKGAKGNIWYPYESSCDTSGISCQGFIIQLADAPPLVERLDPTVFRCKVYLTQE